MSETDYDLSEMTVADVREYVADVEDPDVLTEMYSAEQQGKDRTTALDAIEDRIDDLDIDIQPGDGDDEPEADADLDAEGDGDGDGDESSPTETDPGEFVRVRPYDGGGHIAGYSFEDGELKQVRLDGKVQRALSRGELQLIR